MCLLVLVHQVLSGLFPISQVREPYSAIRYLAERLPVEQIYQLVPPADDYNPERPYVWSPFMLCEAYAIKRGYNTKNGRPDTYRGALEILRDAVDGAVCLYFDPPPIRPTSATATPAADSSLANGCDQDQSAATSQHHQSNDDNDNDNDDDDGRQAEHDSEQNDDNNDNGA
jgi:ribosome biogenesis GTPase A